MTCNSLTVLASVLGGAAGAALIAGIFGLINRRLNRKEKLNDRECAQTKALRYIMLYIIQERAEKYIAAAKITLDERRSLHKWHKLYHDGLGGNGDADTLMVQIDKLPLDLGV